VQGRWTLEDAGQLVGIGAGEGRGVQIVDPQPVGEQPWRAEGALHRELLVQQHPEHEGERVAAEQFVGRRVLGDGQGRHPRDPASSNLRRTPARAWALH
jgi:hypothetical protein